MQSLLVEFVFVVVSAIRATAFEFFPFALFARPFAFFFLVRFEFRFVFDTVLMLFLFWLMLLLLLRKERVIKTFHQSAALLPQTRLTL